MKLLFIADHHIKLGQRNVPREWAKNRYRLLWEDVLEAAKHYSVDYIVHGGDVFDDVPSMEEIAVYIDMLDTLKEYKNIIYPGNHEAVRKNTSFLTHLTELSRKFNCEIVSSWMNEKDVYDRFGIENVSILPYTDLHSKKWHNVSGKFLLTHVRGAIEPHVKPEVDLELFSGWDLVFAGDLHAHSNTQGNIVYPGSPITTSFHRTRSEGENGLIVIDSNLLSWEHVVLELPQLIRKTVESEDEIVATDHDHTIYELVGDKESLAGVKDSELIDKKLSHTVVDATLDFTEALTIEDELALYLKERENILDTAEYVSLFKDIT